MLKAADYPGQRLVKLLLTLVVLACAACATVMPNMDPPKVSFENIRSLP